jgi:hypothetical protein
MHYCSEIWVPKIALIENQLDEILDPYDNQTENKKYLEFVQEESDLCDNCKEKCKDGEGCGYYRNSDGVIGYDNNPNGFYDWYQIGGIYSGHKIKNYDPVLDPRNHKKCNLCNGTGFREENICNRCGKFDYDKKIIEGYESGKKGIMVEWPGWNHLDVNILHVDDVEEETFCFTAIYKNIVNHIEVWEDHKFIKTGFDGNLKNFILKNNITTGYFVTVDYHN